MRGELLALRGELALSPVALEPLARSFVERLVVLAQACLLRADAPDLVAQGFLETRLRRRWGHVLGAIDGRQLDVNGLLERAYCTGSPAR